VTAVPSIAAILLGWIVLSAVVGLLVGRILSRVGACDEVLPSPRGLRSDSGVTGRTASWAGTGRPTSLTCGDAP
jgi:hypothetical protein